MTEPDTPIFLVETLEDDATHASAHDPGANAAYAGQVPPPTAIPTMALIPVKTEDHAEMSDASPGGSFIDGPGLDDDARSFQSLS